MNNTEELDLTGLKELQALIANAIMQPLVDDSIASVTGGVLTNDLANGLIEPSLKMSALERLEIYNQQYWYRLTDAMREDFPGVLNVLGDRRFNQLAVNYLCKHPSASFSLQNLGSRFFDYVSEEHELTNDLHQLVLDLIRFEWAEIQSFEAEEKLVLDSKTIAGINTQEIHLQLQPHVFVLSLSYSVDSFLLKQKSGVCSESRNRDLAWSEQSSKTSQPSAEETDICSYSSPGQQYLL